jgi:hypothetical protein
MRKRLKTKAKGSGNQFDYSTIGWDTYKAATKGREIEAEAP